LKATMVEEFSPPPISLSLTLSPPL